VLVLDLLDYGDIVCWVLIVVCLAYNSHFLQASVTSHENSRCRTPNWTYSCLWMYNSQRKIQQDVNSVSTFFISYFYETQCVSGDTPPIIGNLKLH
jgi:hypothetical protein